MAKQDAAASLRRLGWRVRTTGELAQAVKHFQGAWLLGPALKVDGVPGPKTAAALSESLAALAAGKGTMSRHFSFSEFACRCGGKYTKCPRIWVRRELVQTLEQVRARFYPGGLTVVSGCRCEDHNRAVGGATGSQHKYGTACDIEPKVSWQTLRAAHLAAGIGYKRSNGRVTHIDRRDIGGSNTTGGKPARPTVWIYSS